MNAMASITGRLPLGDYQRLAALAQREGLVTGKGKPNLSEALRRATRAGLDALEIRLEQTQTQEGTR